MNELLTRLSESIVFQCHCRNLIGEGQLILSSTDYPTSGIPGRELRILTEPKEFSRLEISPTRDLTFYYKRIN
jgi:hypothetical protein